MDESIFNFSMLMSDTAYADRDKVQDVQFAFYSKGRIDYTPHYEHLEKLVQAIEEKRVYLVRYKAAGAKQSKEHHFAPHRLVSMNNALYALGAGVTDEYRSLWHLTNLAVHRIIDVVITDKPILFEMPVNEGMFGLPWHEPRTFRIRFKAGKTADYVRERIWSDSQRMEELENGDLLLEIVTRSEPELTAWVRSFGEEAAFVPLQELENKE
ncbi:MAG: WYL domain-containing protein [Desulfovibrionaceae bacterium]|nr:WYL domain-containing protein [Desulfovibrionaceae bacterium]